ncbi:MAG: type II toxin-antitoxin system RelB/DinJ family antitoxin [Clostridiales Family XIII bacterium]|jgi:DNA-damage-inducible protein J|nr:type II toxin-antitoxin system RelB/DinJ family antitoxin [Clostridiales Family XIII bacterium]
MATVQLATRIEQEQLNQFRNIAKAIGTTPADALRMFVAAFVAQGGFPYLPRVQSVEAFESEEDATEFASRMSKRIINETR